MTVEGTKKYKNKTVSGKVDTHAKRQIPLQKAIISVQSKVYKKANASK
jgi:hypothetical protein